MKNMYATIEERQAAEKARDEIVAYLEALPHMDPIEAIAHPQWSKAPSGVAIKALRDAVLSLAKR